MRNPDIPRPDLSQAIACFYDREEYMEILRTLREGRDEYIAHFGSATDPNRVMSLAGGVGAFDYMLGLLDPEGRLPK